MLTIIGTLWPIAGLPASIFLASMTSSPAWRWAALLGAPAAGYAIHYWIGMILVGAIYFPVIIIMAVLWFVRRGFS
jgi:hypothetical protein